MDALRPRERLESHFIVPASPFEAGDSMADLWRYPARDINAKTLDDSRGCSNAERKDSGRVHAKTISNEPNASVRHETSDNRSRCIFKRFLRRSANDEKIVANEDVS